MKKNRFLIFVVVLCFAAGTLFFSCNTSQVFKRYKVDLPAFYSDKHAALATPLTKGKYIIGIYDPSCDHCRKAALAMHELQEKYPQMPFFMFVNCTLNSSYDSTNLHDFWEVSHAYNVPNACLDMTSFRKNTSGAFPLIIWVRDGWVEANTSLNEFDEAKIRRWLR